MIRPSTALSMTLAMFDVLTVQGPNNAKTLSNIYDNLIELRKALERIEAEANKEDDHDDHNEQTENV